MLNESRFNNIINNVTCDHFWLRKIPETKNESGDLLRGKIPLYDQRDAAFTLHYCISEDNINLEAN